MPASDIDDHMEKTRVADVASRAQNSGPGTSVAPALKAPGTEGLFFDWARLTSYLLLLKEYYRLYAATLALSIVLAFVNSWFAHPIYTAVAVIGPPGPSPTGALVGTGGGLHAALSTSLLGAGGSGAHDSFQDFLQLLPSSRLSQALIDRDGFLQIIYAGQWNAEKQQWKPPGAFRSASNAIKRMRHFAVSDHPGVDDLSKFFAAQLSVVHASSGPSAGLLAKQSPYMVVSLNYGTPEGAERMLRVILAEADRLVREDDGRDVAARVVFLRNELLRQDVSIDERAALTSILSGQEQVQAMIRADERYASTLIVPPHASLEPASPPPLSKIATYTIVWSFVGWIGLVVLGAHVDRIGRLIRWARRKKRTRRSDEL